MDGIRMERLKAIIKEAFGHFDSVDQGTILHEEVPAVFRYLGQFPSETEVVEKIIKEMQEGDPSVHATTYEAFESVMLKAILNHEYDPEDCDTLLMAFRVLDPERKGYIEVQQMRDYLASGSFGFRPKEITDFLEFAKDKDGPQDKIYYEDYVAKLTDFVDNHLNSVFKAIR
uniref:EF-hand domain-containing protein n=1 Tax=Chromera velia CCMP2878 TaxID=1169474 RepID=A0A0G4I7G0_9ALVE|eukprot:Cvel_11622.t1-p1 / transcript=Cvel_11622.t1 / gene=Cvel_11622 / organism=Chromera_velia_CCMP2878 / gene_product=EF-hand calcium-binding domain-containing protein 2, putative / transcript_product=EF-hand calcium-binding domain-containing protein 2, putative / location=Cvel_scaffold736:18626-21074(+) / protein_length=171 / sequence_SO=supercontig / SO=protein_coding / is_pseudo=false